MRNITLTHRLINLFVVLGLEFKLMKKYSIQELAEIIKAQKQPTAVSGRVGLAPPIPTFNSVNIDSRTIKAGECFFAIAGKNFDGHNYVSEVLAKGATCAVVEREIPGVNPAGSRILMVNDTIKALGDLARHERKRANHKVVALTGSVGKTTTRNIIYTVLSAHLKVHQAPKSFNNNIGLPLTLLSAGNDTQAVIVELGTNHPGEISYLTHIACPDIAVVTNVAPAHLEGFGSLDAIAKEKLSIAEGLTADGVLIINADCEILVRRCRDKGIKFLSFGISQSADYRAQNIRYESLASRFTIDGREIFLPLPGPGNVQNATAAWAVCSRFDITIEQFAEAIATVSAVTGRTEMLQIGTLTVLNDCYNANPASMKNALAILANIDSAGQQRKVFICGDMGELGEQSEALHSELGRNIAEANVNLVIAAGRLSKIAAESAKSQSKNNLEINCFADTISACNNLHKIIRDYDIILVKGSRSAGLESAVAKLKEIFASGDTGRAK
jgi:UDP-N-acetylmuramoyl-tripeptide--D-alanyl-D-alanine ligase